MGGGYKILGKVQMYENRVIAFSTPCNSPVSALSPPPPPPPFPNSLCFTIIFLLVYHFALNLKGVADYTTGSFFPVSGGCFYSVNIT